MKKTMLVIKTDEEKLSAIKLYMSKKGADFDEVMAAQLEKLYEKYVPSNVREFITEHHEEDCSIKSRPGER